MPAATEELVRKEVALGTVRELEPPQAHIGLRVLAPFQDVPTDDVIFDYAKPEASGLAPARAEDAESELAQKDLIYGGQGRASILDWALKDHYTASDVMRYRESLLIQARLQGVTGINVPLTVGGPLEEFRSKLARHDALRRKKLDNRLKWLIMQSLETSAVSYNDGKIKFTVSWGRPSNQTDEAPTGAVWSDNDADPIGDILAVQEFMYDTYGVRMTRAITSKKVLNNIVKSDRFAARSGLVGATGSLPVDPRYIMDGWGPQAAIEVVQRATGLTFIEYDAVYRTRNIGSTTTTNVRFTTDTKVFFLPDPQDVAELDDTIGFGKTLTSPHPEGNWTSGFYAWEQETKDPWGQDRGTGIKAFPVFPHMDWTYTMVAL